MKKACVIGFPVRHSLSPVLHGYWLARYGIDGRYDAREVPPQDLAAALRGLEAQGYAGCNITLPHKEQAAALMDETDPAARAIGAVNTVEARGGRLYGYNSDAEGFLRNLEACAPDWRRDTACLLGAGGAARAVAYALKQAGVEKLYVMNRTRARSEKLAADFGAQVLDWGAAPRVSLFVNATSLGMQGQPPLTANCDALPQGAVVCDLVYRPLETPLLQRARAAGAVAVDGLGMLLHQAAAGFKLWFGTTPAVTREVRDFVTKGMNG